MVGSDSSVSDRGQWTHGHCGSAASISPVVAAVLAPVEAVRDDRCEGVVGSQVVELFVHG
jgi:hypothetical protein